MPINTVFLEGLLTSELALKPINDTQLCTASMKVGFYEKGESTSEFFKIEIWGKQAADAANKLVKGDICLVQGRLKKRQWTDKLGNIKTDWAIVVTQIDQLMRKPSNSAPMPLGKQHMPNRDISTGQGTLEDATDDEIDLSGMELPF